MSDAPESYNLTFPDILLNLEVLLHKHHKLLSRSVDKKDYL
jgi:hypothetical protein